MNRFLFSIICCLGFLLFSIIDLNSQNSPNILFILADDLGYGDLACYGHREVKTPNLDKLAEQGLRLTHFYSPSPLCSPARAGFLTGRTPFRTGIQSWIPEGQDIYLRQEEITIASALKENGYQTFFGGKWHLNGGLANQQQPQPQDHGFDQWLAGHAFATPNHKNPNNLYRNGEPLGTVEGFAAQITVDEAIEWLEKRKVGQPFFIYLAFLEIHSEIASPDEFNDMYKEFTSGEIDLKNVNARGPGEYYANISHMDHQIGRILNKLDELGLAENTLVIFTSDNGPVTTQWRYWWEVNMYGNTEGLRGRKGDLFEGGIRVPAIVRFPGKVTPGSESDIPLHGYDIFPTICSIADIALPDDRPIDGIDFSPIFEGKAVERDKPLFWAFETRQFDDPEGYYFAVRWGDWKLITDKSFEKSLLYNLKDDPYELKDLSAQQLERVEELKQRVESFHQSIQDDLLRPH